MRGPSKLPPNDYERFRSMIEYIQVCTLPHNAIDANTVTLDCSDVNEFETFIRFDLECLSIIVSIIRDSQKLLQL